MAKFHTKLLMTPVKETKGRLWLLEAPLVFESNIAGVIEVPAGFLCDLNSIPRPFWAVSPPSDYPEAGVTHDYLYRYKVVPRPVADAVYREALEVLGAGSVRRFLRYWGVRLGGRGAYNKPAEDRQ